MREINLEINLETAKRLLSVVDAGLTHGLGQPEPGVALWDRLSIEVEI